MKIKDLYNQDIQNVKRWESKYSDKEFYALNLALRKKLNSIFKSQRQISSREMWMAGVILHHAHSIASSKKAFQLATKSYKLGYKPAKTLIAQATDKLLQLQGKPQKFGTQAIKLKNGKWKMYKIDGTITNNQRKEFGLPSLKVLISYLNS